jgi:alpha-amylase/alpha-mannosidase (GH57 family)
MSLSPLRVAFLWHMHQPLYKDPQTGVYRLPWVRFHALKDYYDMAARLADFPAIKANFNLVPSLTWQILDYASGEVADTHLELSRKPANELTEGEKISLLRNSFLGNRRTIVESHPRYRALLDKCGSIECERETETTLKRFKVQDFLDLQVLSNLAWFDPMFKDDPLISDLLARGRDYTENMKADLIAREFDIMGRIIPKYRELLEKGQIELTCCPYYHPILPLLCDSTSAKEAVPGIELPPRRIEFGADAARQIEMGRAYNGEIFGAEPEGMWPPEGALSENSLRLASEAGVRWVAADETMLAASLDVELRETPAGKVTRPRVLYSPHRFDCNGKEMVLVFRDRLLSDLIGFSYMKLRPKDAVDDLISRLLAIRQDLGKHSEKSLVLIALDGENCWEFYDRDGDVFLRTLYSRLSKASEIETVRISDAIEGKRSYPRMGRIVPGSWIGGNLATWIGNSEDNRAWDQLYDAREALLGAEREGGLDETGRGAAWTSIFAAEGSDWFWWWGQESGCSEESEFDALFRTHLMQVYAAVGMDVPPGLLNPIGETCAPGRAVSLEPVAFMKPALDGKVTTFYEWKLAGLYEAYKDGLTHAAGGVISAVYFGFDQERLFLRVDTTVSPQAPEFAELTFRLEFIAPRRTSVSFRAPGPRTPEARDLEVVPGDPMAGAAGVALETVELAIPFAGVSAPPGSTISLRITVSRGGKEIERRPAHRAITLRVPGPDFEAEMWSTL